MTWLNVQIVQLRLGHDLKKQQKMPTSVQIRIARTVHNSFSPKLSEFPSRFLFLFCSCCCCCCFFVCFGFVFPLLGVTSFLFVSISCIPCGKFVWPNLGKTTAAARAALPSPSSVCGIFVYLWTSNLQKGRAAWRSCKRFGDTRTFCAELSNSLCRKPWQNFP